MRLLCHFVSLTSQESRFDNALIRKIDQNGNEEIQRLTPQVKPVIEKVLSPPEDQLDEETKAKVLELVKYLQSK